jgi:DNA-directed RNA polymerase specialized sigma24 family protein
MKAKRIKNINPYLKENVDMNMDDIAKELGLSKTEVKTALKGGVRKFRRHFEKQNIQKEHYL